MRSVVSYPRPVRPGYHGGYRDVCAKRCVFIDWPRRRGGDGCGGGADGGPAVDGLRGLRAVIKGVTATTGTSGATDFSARGRYYRGGGGAAAAAAFAGIVGTGIAIAATQNRRDYYDELWLLRCARRPITAADRPITAAARIMAAATPLSLGRPHYRGIRELVIAATVTSKDQSTGRSAGGFFLVVRPAVNTLATAFD